MHDSWNDVSRRRFIATASATGLSLIAGRALAQPPKDRPASTPPTSTPPTGTPATTAPAPDPAPFFTWENLGEGATAERALGIKGDGGNALLVLAPKGGACVLVDAKVPHVATTLRREVEQRGGKVEMVINTHHHADHIGGNLAFTGDTRVIAHENAKPRVAPYVDRMKQMLKSGPISIERSENPNAKSAQAEVEALAARVETFSAANWSPTRTFSGRIGSESLGSMPIDLHQVGPGHTDNDVIVHFAQLKVLHMGDLVFHNLYPFIDRDGGASVRGWIRSLKYARRLCKTGTVVIPGHGDITDASGIDAMSDFLEKSLDFVEKQIKQKKTRDEIVKMTPPGAESRGFEHLREAAMGALYDEIKG
jgi:cyclase